MIFSCVFLIKEIVMTNSVADKVKEIIPYVNQLIINNYCLDMKLHKNVREIYDYAKSHEEEFKDVELLVQMRYKNAVLTNRAGSAPNKKNDVKIIIWKSNYNMCG